MTRLTPATAVARSNIALVKYWGKAARPGNYPAVPSLSLTLEALATTTAVEPLAELTSDELWLDGERAEQRPLERVRELLTRLRAGDPALPFARVTSQNDFPTAAGLASSASGFAALVVAANAAYQLRLSVPALSAAARQSSASAARSLFGGFAELDVEADAAEALQPERQLPLCMVIAITARGPKAIGSTEGMRHTALTSPYYEPWVRSAPALFEAGKAAAMTGDLEALGEVMEHSTLMMHACMLAARPAISYLNPATWAVIEAVRQLREKRDLPCYFTMDAGPHVKILTLEAHAAEVRLALDQLDAVQATLVSDVGSGAELVRGSNSPESPA